MRRAGHIIWFEQQAAGSAALQVHIQILWVDMAGSACAMLVLMNDAYGARI
jgi:hypothetical protein